MQLNILQYLTVHLGCDLGVGGALGELLPDRHKGEDGLPVHEEELPPVNPRLVLQHKLVSVVTILVAAHLRYCENVWNRIIINYLKYIQHFSET